MQQFLENAKIVTEHGAKKGVTGTLRATLVDGPVTHDVSVQTIDESKTSFTTDRGTELNFKDSYKYNIAAYRLGVLLGIDDMIPMSVYRKVGGKSAAVTWWIDNVEMDEVTRVNKHIEVPDPEKWNEQMYVVRVFDQLIYNVDRNLQNLLITKDWQIWMIDHSRSFRLMTNLRSQKDLVKCDRMLLGKLRALDEGAVSKELLPFCTKSEIKAMMARRDKIVSFFDGQIKARGEAAVLYDRPHFGRAVPTTAN
jgi:hypothetical protein